MRRGNLIRTLDGGQTWQQATPRTEAFYDAVLFVDAQHGWALANDPGITGYEAAVWRTVDGGVIWSRIVVR